MQPWLSVAMPVHNGEGFLAATLQSAADERPDGVEFILLDSGADHAATRQIVEMFADRLDVRLVAAPGTVSWTAKTNRAVREARAAHVCMLHQDDLWRAGHVSALRAAIARDPEAVLSIAPSVFIDQNGRPMGKWRLPFAAGRVAREEFLSTLLVQNSVAIPSPVIRRDGWLECGGLDDGLWYTADWDLYLKLGRLGTVIVRPEATTAFRLHGSSLTVRGAKDAAAFRQQLETVVERHLPEVPRTMRARTARLAHASVELNCLLAAALHKTRPNPMPALKGFIGLGPSGAIAFLRKSRLADRVWPRLRLGLLGGL